MSEPRLRDDLSALEGYHSAQVDVEVRLNTNESPFTMPPGFAAALEARIGAIELNRYPDRSASALRSRLAGLHGVSPSEIFVANGSNEVLQSILLAFGGPGRSALVFEPTYALHSHIARVTGTDVLVAERGPDFALIASEVAAAVADAAPDVVFLCSPNNPTGGVDDLEVVEAAIEASAGLVVVDEAYGQFAAHSALDLRRQPGLEQLVVVRTFSKTWALAGARVGYLVAHPAVVSGCEVVALPYHLSALTQAAGEVALDFSDEMERKVGLLIEQRGRVEAALRELDVDVWPSSANFILFRPRRREGHQVWQDLVERSVLVRDCSSWDRLDGCLRVTIGTEEENQRFIEAVREVVGK